MRTVIRPAALALAAALAAAGCAGVASPSPSPSPAPSVAPSEAPSPSPSPDPCATANLKTVNAGKLTIGTDTPAYPPYFDGGTKAGSLFELNDPSTGQGFESAVAYAVADKLGFTGDQVTWVVVKFDNSYAPGPKSFDFDINQVSYKPERAQTADLSDGYYYLNQALVAVKDTPIASAKSLADLAGYRFGAQAGTTSYDAIVNVIKPSKEPRIYDSNDAAIEALKNKQIDGLVVDLPTAFYVTAVQMDNGVIVGQFPPTGGEQEHFSLVLAKDSPLTPCVNKAIAALKADGTLAKITQEWLADKANAPVIQP